MTTVAGPVSCPVDLNRHVMRDPTATFLVRVSGDSSTTDHV